MQMFQIDHIVLTTFKMTKNGKIVNFLVNLANVAFFGDMIKYTPLNTYIFLIRLTLKKMLQNSFLEIFIS